MPLITVLYTFGSWLIKTVVIKSIVMSVIFVIVTQLTPIALEYLGSFISAGSLTSAFGGIPSGVWFFLDFFALDIGMPLLISAHVSAFLIRRIPFIG